MRKIAIVEDNPAELHRLTAMLSSHGRCVPFTDGETFLKAIYRDTYDLACVDWNLPEVTGVNGQMNQAQPVTLPCIANGCLQFSILGGDDNVSKWPDYPDESRFKRFLRGYDEVMLLSQAEIQAIPWLMIEALIAEAVFPIAATGTFGRMEGLSFLQMVQRKIGWLNKQADRLIELAEG